MKYNKIVKNIRPMYYVKEMVFISPCRKVLLKLGIYIVSLLLAMVICIIPQIIIYQSKQILRQDMRFTTDLKYILFWRPQIIKKDYHTNRDAKYKEGQSAFIKQKCKYVNCYITYKKDLLKRDHRNLDAIVFDMRDIVNFDPKSFDLVRSSEQKYIFRSIDSSERYPVCNSFFDNFFNWTWTYKLDSDIPHPFFNIYDAKNKLVGPKRDVNWIVKMNHNDISSDKRKTKTKAVAWLLTKCKLKARYEDFIGDLSKELNEYNYTLDIFGACGYKKCPGKHIANCHKMIERNYYFQLVLEDSLAIDYVTERMGKAMTYKTIPIIIGVSNYNRFLPPGSYINAQTLDIKKLGAIINYLIHYPTTYEYFFDWKKYYYYTMKPRFDVCDLCAKLNHNGTSNPTVYDKFRMWWSPNFVDRCRNFNYNFYEP